MHEIRIVKSVLSHQDPRPSLEAATVEPLELSDHIRVRDPTWLELIGLAMKVAAIGVTLIGCLFAAQAVL